MRDKETKKRIRVDYQLIIELANLTAEFSSYLFKQKRVGSIRRAALAFLKTKKINIEYWYYEYTLLGFTCYADYLEHNIKLAKDHSWIIED